jgi:MFS family permease
VKSTTALENCVPDEDAPFVGDLKRVMAESVAAFRAVFRNRNLRSLELAVTASSLGGWGYSIAVSVYAYQIGGTKAVGIMWLCRLIPPAVLAPFSGVIADRYRRELVMLSSDLVRFGVVLLATVAVWQDWPSTVVYVVAAVNATLRVPFETAAAALLPRLARTPEELTASNVATSTIESVGFFVGPALAGAILAVSTVQVAFLTTAGAILVSAVFVRRIKPDSEPKAPTEAETLDVAAAGESFVSEALVGFKLIGSDRRLRVLVSLYSAASIAAGAVEVLIVAVAFQLLNSGESTVGYLNSAFGIGALIGAGVTMGIVGMRRLSYPFLVGASLWVAPLLLAAFPTAGVAVAVLVVLGISNPLLDVPCFTLMQRTVPEHVLARVFGALQLIWMASLAVGSVAVAPLISGAGIKATLVILGCFMLVVVAVLGPRLVAIDADAAAPAADRLELLRRTPIFAPLPGATLERLAQQLVPTTVPKGETFIREGDVGDRFYIISSGSVDVTSQGKPVATLRTGDYVGEIALIRDVPRTATVTAREDVELYSLGREDFLAAVTSHVASREALELTVATRLSGLGEIGRVVVPRV